MKLVIGTVRKTGKHYFEQKENGKDATSLRF